MTDPADALARALVETIGQAYADVVDPELAARCWADYGPSMSADLLARLQAAGFAVVPVELSDRKLEAGRCPHCDGFGVFFGTVCGVCSGTGRNAASHPESSDGN